MEAFGTAEAARVLLSCIGFVEEGARGLEGSEGLLGRLRLLRGAVVVGGTAVRLEGSEGLLGRLGLLRGSVLTGGTAVRLPGIGIMMDSGRWDGPYLKRLGR